MVHVLRCFEDDDVTHVDGKIDPIADAETVETELMLADLDSLNKRIPNLERRIRGQDKEAKAILGLVQRVITLLEEGLMARTLERADAEEERLFEGLQLLTGKPVLYVCNVDEGVAANGNEFSAKVAKKAEAEGAGCVIISAAIEAEISQMDSDAEKREFLADMGLEETGLARIIRAGYQLLGLQTYFTAGPKEARAWTITKGTRAPQAAGVIHTDFEKGFIRAETTAFADYIALGGEHGAKDAGKMRLEGKDYVVQDGDIMMFRFAN
nr:redox-regulated ATPase YchF [Iodidimonas nitroreducens]